MNKETKREMKAQRKIIYIFLAIALPVMILFAYLLFTLAPSLINQQWIVVALIVVFGLVGWFLLQLILKRQAEKNKSKPKKPDPYAD